MKTDNKWITSRTKAHEDIIAALLRWEPKAINIHVQDTHKHATNNELYSSHCFYAIAE